MAAHSSYRLSIPKFDQILFEAIDGASKALLLWQTVLCGTQGIVPPYLVSGRALYMSTSPCELSAAVAKIFVTFRPRRSSVGQLKKDPDNGSSVIIPAKLQSKRAGPCRTCIATFRVAFWKYTISVLSSARPQPTP